MIEYNTPEGIKTGVIMGANDGEVIFMVVDEKDVDNYWDGLVEAEMVHQDEVITYL